MEEEGELHTALVWTYGEYQKLYFIKKLTLKHFLLMENFKENRLND